MDELKQAILQNGGLTKTARQLGITKQQLNNWLRSNGVPAKHCTRIEEMFGISRKLLCQNWALYWPELEKPAAIEVQAKENPASSVR